MSVIEFFADVFHGRWTSAVHRLVNLGQTDGKPFVDALTWFIEQFADDVGKEVGTIAAGYAPLVIKGELSFSDCLKKIEADFAEAGCEDFDALADKLGNALRVLVEHGKAGKP